MTGKASQTIGELTTTLESIRETREATCDLCGEVVDLSDAQSWGDVLDTMAEHGESRDDHKWVDGVGWVYEP